MKPGVELGELDVVIGGRGRVKQPAQRREIFRGTMPGRGIVIADRWRAAPRQLP